MLSVIFRINGKDFSPYAHKNGLSATYTPVAGLSSEFTRDGTEHNDILTIKATYAIRLNPCPLATAREILSEYRGNVFLTISDFATGEDKTMYCKTSEVPVDTALVKRGTIQYVQLGDLTFGEM